MSIIIHKLIHLLDLLYRLPQTDSFQRHSARHVKEEGTTNPENESCEGGREDSILRSR